MREKGKGASMLQQNVLVQNRGVAEITIPASDEAILDRIWDSIGQSELRQNEFCPTGSGGGVDPTCSPKDRGVKGECPPPCYRPSRQALATGRAARVGVPPMSVPPPPPIGRLPNLTETERRIEGAFIHKYESNPDGVANTFRQEVHRVAKEKGQPPTFGTDDAKSMATAWSAKNIETRAENRARLNLVLHQTANAIAKRAFVHELNDLKPGDEIMVTAGGCGAGKGYSLDNVPEVKAIRDKCKAIWDSAGDQCATEHAWVQKEAEARGIKVHYVYVHADPYDSWANPERGVVQRARKPTDGRMVDAKVFADSYARGARNHWEFQEKHDGNPAAEFHYINSTGKKPEKVDSMPKDALNVDRRHLTFYANNVVMESGAPDRVVAGGTIGNRIWGVSVDNEHRLVQNAASDDDGLAKWWEEDAERLNRMADRIRKSGKAIEVPDAETTENANPHHDERGRFTFATGMGDESVQIDPHNDIPSWRDPHPDWRKRAYGGVVFDNQGRFLLREPTNHFDGYSWTFSKGRLDHEQEKPADTARREVSEEMGIKGDIVGAVPGAHVIPGFKYIGEDGKEHTYSGSHNYFFLMRQNGEKHEHDWETHQTKWATYDEAKELISRSTNLAGRNRDLKVLAAARNEINRRGMLDKELKQNAFCPTGTGGGKDNSCSPRQARAAFKGKSLHVEMPPIPKFYGGYAKENETSASAMQKLASKAVKGNKTALEALENHPGTASPKLQQYKKDLISTVKGFESHLAKVEIAKGMTLEQAIGQVKEKLGEFMEPKPALMQSPETKMPPAPKFISSQKANVETNEKAVAEMRDLAVKAKAGDAKAAEALKEHPGTPSPKVQEHKQALLDYVSGKSVEPKQIGPIPEKVKSGMSPQLAKFLGVPESELEQKPTGVTKFHGEPPSLVQAPKKMAPEQSGTITSAMAVAKSKLGLTDEQVKDATTKSVTPGDSARASLRAKIASAILESGQGVKDAVLQVHAKYDKAAASALVKQISAGSEAKRAEKEYSSTPLGDLQVLSKITVRSDPVSGQAVTNMVTRSLTMGSTSVTGDFRHELGHAIRASWGDSAMTSAVKHEYSDLMSRLKADPPKGINLSHDDWETKYGAVGKRGRDNFEEHCAEHYRLYQREIYRDLHEGGNGKFLAQYRQRHPGWARIWDAHYTTQLLGMQ
jgi:8-oxo-dGTP diphosphatase